MPTKKIGKVPQAKVGATVQQFIDFDDATKVVCTKDVAGTWTIEADVPK